MSASADLRWLYRFNGALRKPHRRQFGSRFCRHQHRLSYRPDLCKVSCPQSSLIAALTTDLLNHTNSSQSFQGVYLAFWEVFATFCMSAGCSALHLQLTDPLSISVLYLYIPFPFHRQCTTLQYSFFPSFEDFWCGQECRISLASKAQPHTADCERHVDSPLLPPDGQIEAGLHRWRRCGTHNPATARKLGCCGGHLAWQVQGAKASFLQKLCHLRLIFVTCKLQAVVCLQLSIRIVLLFLESQLSC